ncbi:MAG: NADH-quinone oxidoreductase subunit H [Candidatus Omnitrophica bacterium]|nr:NADH-quinone oxidoreductase subunit H [Candidatus Omnitrophota bacterium]MDD5552315.1 NADH-quinone oxidoreductase subunit H [Candidatus Omnitrophota bacterium]
MKLLFNYLLFPGFLFSACVGLIAGWVDRKVTARIQWRKGPPWYQNFVDLMKLLGKETIIPQGASRMTFLLAPFLGLLSAVLVATILGVSLRMPLESFAGDVIVILYLLTMPAVSMILGGSSSRNPLASVGASREMKLVLGYELPFILSILAVIIRSGGSIQLGPILNQQINFGSNLASWPGALAFIAAIFCMQAKLGFVPFDVAEAEQEIMAGAVIEYSGLPLAVFRLTKAVLLYTIPLFLIALFWAGNLSWLALTGKYIAVLVIIILIKNTNPRLRIDQAMRFFWGPVTALAGISVILALFGL